MKALVIHAPRDLRLEEREPDPLGADEVRVALATGGVCGSDLHYYNDGGFGAIRLKEPMILGHEVAGHVTEVGANVTGLTLGMLVAVSPSRPCGKCKFCLAGMPHQCLNMRFYGSAMPFPHIQGAFRTDLVALASQCVPADGLSPGAAAMAEPLAVVLHAMRRAGELVGRRVLVTGCGPIGALAILAARRAGAVEIVATDLAANALAKAKAVGADVTHNMAEDRNALAQYAADKGTFDVVFECSGAAPALADAIEVTRPQGVIVQIGISGDMAVPMVPLTAKEIDLRGAFRFHEEYPVAVKLMQGGLINVDPLITHTVPLADAERAFTTANDRSQAMKVQIAFDSAA